MTLIKRLVEFIKLEPVLFASRMMLHITLLIVVLITAMSLVGHRPWS